MLLLVMVCALWSLYYFVHKNEDANKTFIKSNAAHGKIRTRAKTASIKSGNEAAVA